MFDIAPGEWVRPIMSGYRAQCCDCGLIHKMDFAVVEDESGELVHGYEVLLRAWREEPSEEWELP